jgi:hypothetical protein
MLPPPLQRAPQQQHQQQQQHDEAIAVTAAAAVAEQHSSAPPLLRSMCLDAFRIAKAVQSSEHSLYIRVIRLLSHVCVQYGQQAALHLLIDTTSSGTGTSSNSSSSSDSGDVRLIARLISFVRCATISL